MVVAGKLLIALGNCIATSPDGIKWTIQNRCRNPYNGENFPIQGEEFTGWTATYGNSTFVVAGDDGNVIVSKNGVDWELRKTGISIFMHTIIWNGSKFVGIANSHSTGGSPYDGDSVVISDDGINWTARSTDWDSDIEHSIFWTGNQYVKVCQFGDIFVSSDGIAWRPYGCCPSEVVTDAVWNGKTIVAVGCGILTCTPEKGF